VAWASVVQHVPLRDNGGDRVGAIVKVLKERCYPCLCGRGASIKGIPWNIWAPAIVGPALLHHRRIEVSGTMGLCFYTWAKPQGGLALILEDL
jgi:hypothetical protein